MSGVYGHGQNPILLLTPEKVQALPDIELPTLPDEILFHIFSYLPHKQLLQVRQLNLYWNHFITTSQAIQNSTIFRICPRNECSINQNLLANQMPLRIPWKKVCLDETCFMLQIPIQKELRKITSLYIKQLNHFEWIYAQDLLSQLRSLQHLYIKTETGICNVMENKIEDDLEVIEKFQRVSRNLKSLTLISGSGDFVLFILRKFIPYANGLEEIRIEIGEDYKAKNAQLCKELYKIISGPAATLKVLDILLNDKQFACDDFCTYVLSRLKVNQIQLNLQEFHLRNVEVRGVYESVLIDFVTTQPNLVAAFIPTLKTSTCLPRTLMKLSLLKGSGLEPQKLQYFHDLSELQIYNDLAGIGIQNLATKGNSCASYPKLQTLSVSTCGFPFHFDQHLDRLFPRLTKLVIDTVEVSPDGRITVSRGVTDLNVQMIAKNLVNLQHLSLKNCESVTCSGWTGIRTEFLNGLTDEQLENLDFEVPENERIGVPLGSLKYLKVLDIQTTGQISNVALKYGFTFPEIIRLSIVDVYGAGLSEFDHKSIKIVCSQLQTLEFLRMRLTKEIRWEEKMSLVKMLPNMVDTLENFSLLHYHFLTPCQSYRNWMSSY